jgi:hypothetical protein
MLAPCLAPGMKENAMNPMRRFPAVLAVVGLFAADGVAAIRLSANSVWRGQGTNWPTGVAWTDIDLNGWQDLVVTNGLDVAFAPNFVYFNNGTLSTSPGWVSCDSSTFDNVLIADMDNDGDMDIVVARLGNTNQGLPPLPHVIYLNDSGTLHVLPDWYSQPGNAFSGAIGDPDGDGDIDIVFAQGDYFTGHKQRTVMYRNDGGTFDTLPSWQTDSGYYATDAHFVDLDNDGDLDLVVGSDPFGIMVFGNDNGMLSTVPTWQTNAVFGGRQMDFGDVNNDGYLDLGVAESGGGLHLFLNHGGVLDSLPSWSCTRYREPSAVAWADADDDGDMDLAAGGWFSNVGVFENTGGVLTDSFVWSVGRLQQVAWGDFDNDGLVDTSRAFIGNGQRKFFYLARKPVQRILAVELDRTPLPLQAYCCDPAEGWVSLAQAPATGETLTIRYRYSVDLDLAITATYVEVFENQVYGGVDEQRTGMRPTAGLELRCPVIHGSGAAVSYSLPRAGRTVLAVFDPLGRELTRLVDSWQPAGEYRVAVDRAQLASGVCCLRLVQNGQQATRKLVVFCRAASRNQ